jgi:hypothetical protein
MQGLQGGIARRVAIKGVFLAIALGLMASQLAGAQQVTLGGDRQGPGAPRRGYGHDRSPSDAALRGGYAMVRSVGRWSGVGFGLLMGLLILNGSMNSISQQLPPQLSVVGIVREFSILSGKLVGLEPIRVVYRLTLEVLQPGPQTPFKAGDLVSVYSAERLLPDLFGETIKASLESRAEGSVLYWLRDFIAVPPKGFAIDQLLYTLTKSADPQAFASKHDLHLVEGRVRVIIELKSPDVLPKLSTAVKVEARSEGFILALVPIAELLILAQDPAVRFIRPPEKPKAASQQQKEVILL